jgi:MFS family permease
VSQRGFVRLLAAYALNELAWWSGTLALSILVYDRTGSAIGSAGFFLSAQAAPAIVSPMLVGRVDRLSPRVTLPALYAVEVVLYAVLAWLTGHFTLAPVLVLAFADGAVALVARSIATAARTQILKPLDLVRDGNALTSTAFSICFLLGPGLSGLIVAAGGTRAALLVSCGLFALLAISLLSSAIPSQIVRAGPSRGRLRTALAEIRRAPAISTLLSMRAITTLLFALPISIEVVLAQHTLHAGPRGYGALLTTWGGGAVAGSFAYARWRNVSVRLLASAGATLVGVGYLIMGLAPGLAVAVVGAAIGGVANGFFTASLNSEVQSLTDQSWVALVQSVSSSITTLMPGLGIITGAAIAELISVRFAFGVAAVGSLVCAVAMLVRLTPERLSAGMPPPEHEFDVALEDELEPARVPHAETLA